MLGFDGDAPHPCPRCKRAAIASRASPAAPSGLHLRHSICVTA
jgi:hypothetical protein